MSAATRCPGCKQIRRRGQYLCIGCWDQLSEVTKRRLSKRDTMAMRRGSELFQQILDGRPLAEIEVTP